MEGSGRRWWRADLAMAAVVTLGMAAAVVVSGPASALPRAGATVVALGLLALAVRRRRPLAVAVVAATVVVVEVVAAPDGTQAPAFVALMVAAYSLGAHAGRVGLTAGAAVSLAAVVVAQLLAPRAPGYSHAAAITFFGAILAVAPMAVGIVVRVQASLGRRLRDRTESNRVGIAERIDDGKAEQRVRIRADVERAVLGGLDAMRPYASVAGLADVTAVRDLGREVLGRMRGLLGELRTDDLDGAAAPARAPGRGLTELRAMVDRVLAAEVTAPARRRTVWSVLTPARVDLALAVLAGAYALLVVASTIGSATAAGPSTGAASTSAVGYAAAAVGAMAALAAAGVRRRPFTATMVAMALVVGYAALIRPADAFEGWVAGLDLIVFPFLVGAALDLGAAAAGLAACVITAGLTVLASRASLSLADLATLGISAGAWMAGRVLRGGARALDAEARLSAAELATQQAVLLAALHADRADVARDLHDAVGHVMTGIVLQASAAIRVWDTPRADAHIVDLRHSLAEALDELRPLLGRLAVDPDPSAEIGGIDALIERARRTGLPVVVHGSLPPSEVDAVVYRVVQESLTNAARHAPGTAVTLRFATDEESIVVEVANAVPSAVLAGLAQAGSGQGLRGMAERVSARGGDLHAAPTAEGGFVVRARVPRARVVA
jgi:signal transduction histidine kinase